jgi:CheY-like chemotaxis protein
VRAVKVARDAGRPYRLLLLDWKMPGMDGVACAHALAQMDFQPHETPVILMVTALSRDEAAQQLADQKVAVSALLNKPVTPSSLLDACNSAVGRTAQRVAQPQPRDPGYMRGAPGELKGARILLVEDNEFNQELAVQLLRGSGSIVSVACNGQEALDALAADSFDVVLMDCQMPVMDGYAATRALRQRTELRDLPVIAMTANAMTGDREAALAAGMNDHIAKPIRIDDMFATLARWLPATNGGTS